MGGYQQIAGGIFVSVLMILTARPFNDEIQGLALAAGATEMIKAVAIVFPYIYIGLLFIVLAYTGYEVTQEIEF